MLPTLQDVAIFAAECHRHQTRKHSVMPYIVHPLAVAEQVRKWGINDDDMIRAAFCHDILEDCDRVPQDVVREAIGDRAFGFVLELTRVVDPRLDEARQKRQYLQSWLKDGQPNKSLESLVIKVADRVQNTLDFHFDRPDYFAKYWHKAHALFHAFDGRADMVMQQFGEATLHRMVSSLNHIESLITRDLNNG